MNTAIDIEDRTAQAEPARDGSRARVLAFVTDDATETALRNGLAEVIASSEIDIKRGSIHEAVKSLQRTTTPEVLIIDISGEAHPRTALGDLSEVVEPYVRVLVIGDQDNVGFYRYLTRELGAVEYLHKPLLADNVARHFGPAIVRRAATADSVHGGRVLAITGTRGGVGATTLVANLAWHLSTQLRHHTVLMDADLQRGTAAMLLGADTGPGLRVALQQPERIDELLIERSAQQVNDRLHVLAAMEELGEAPTYIEGAAGRLVSALRRRYNYIVVDAPCAPLAFNLALLDLAHQRVLVMNPTLASLRDTLRLIARPSGGAQSRRALVVLNRSTMPGGLSREQIEKMLGFAPDITIPDLPAAIEAAATLGTPAAASRSAFRKAIIELAASVGLAEQRRADAPVVKPRRRLFGLRR